MKKTLLIAMASTLVGCGGTNQIACDNPEVVELTTQIMKEQTSESLFKVIFDQEYGLIRYVAEMDYATFKEHARDSDGTSYAAVASKTEAILNSLRLTNIRQIDVNAQVGINRCAATVNDGKQDGGTIEYTTQITKDGKLFVEVF